MNKSFKAFLVLVFYFYSNTSAFCSAPSNLDPDTAGRINQAAQLCNKGTALRQEGKLQESRTVLQQACSYDPNMNSAAVHENLGITLQKLNDYRSAITEFMKSFQFDPSRPSTTFNLANSFSQLGELDKAILCLQEFLKRYPNSPDAEHAKKMLLSLQNTPQLRDNAYDSNYLPSALNPANKLVRWPSQKQPIKVYIDPAKKVDGYNPYCREQLIDAFNRWIAVVNDYLSWTLVSKKKKADIVCYWVSNRDSFRQPKSAEMGETVSKYSLDPKRRDCPIVNANITLCTKDLDDMNMLTDAQMKSLCLHEVGHALGIQGHSSNNNDIMFISLGQHNTNTDLSERDKATMRLIYISN